MERLKSFYPGESVDILVSQDELLLLLVGGRHVRYEKTNLSFLNGFKLSLPKTTPSFEEIAAKVRSVYHQFLASDIQSVDIEMNRYVVTVKTGISIHFGQFHIYKDK